MTPEEEAAAQKLAAEEAAKKKTEEELAASDLFKQTVQKQVDEQLKDIKSKLDTVYTDRDDLKKKLKEKEDADRAAELKRLQDEGKHREAYEMQMKELNEKNTALETQNIELTRNVEVRQLLGTAEFRNDAAREMAFKEITGELLRDAKGIWMHKSGIPMKDFVKTFLENEANSFLLKPKTNSGGGSGGGGGGNNGGGDTNKSLFAMPQAEVIKLAAEGKLPKR